MMYVSNFIFVVFRLQTYILDHIDIYVGVYLPDIHSTTYWLIESRIMLYFWCFFVIFNDYLYICGLIHPGR